ncbi:STAS-like domain-containing protein [Sandaracinus amylolyticus]|uniref:STAS-like domain-containing protein n=1 Tax=Sandaracinus amylolyticus TaxID=927083 RepID=UPI001F3E3C51|nr:STAS-like domain-containing protein [Sandaracinus amylolyticus]
MLVELMRNAVQHSADPRGGVIAAQLMKAGYSGYPQPVVQVAVADTGVGVLAGLQASYPELADAKAAVVKALEPHVSGTFGPGRTGTSENAGMGLFFISEMAKLTAGRMLLATRGATLWLRGDLEGGYASHRLDILPPEGTGFPGTLVAFELPLGEPADHARMIETITEKARQRTPQRDTSAWVRFEAAPKGTPTFVVSTVSEDVKAAARLSREQIQPRLFRREPVSLDFRNVSVCTQSFLHALLFEAIRISWAVQTPIFVEHAEPGVATGVRLVDNYARGG